jgi:hypothetical protein
MRHRSNPVPPVARKGKVSRKHVLSTILAADKRVVGAPRHVEVLYKDESGKAVFVVKVYAGFETPGSELMTVAAMAAAGKTEFELRFDEHFPISFRYKTESDEERTKHATEQIERAGGAEKLRSVFAAVFPEFQV